jgi:hypothetical protein
MARHPKFEGKHYVSPWGSRPSRPSAPPVDTCCCEPHPPPNLIHWIPTSLLSPLLSLSSADQNPLLPGPISHLSLRHGGSSVQAQHWPTPSAVRAPTSPFPEITRMLSIQSSPISTRGSTRWCGRRAGRVIHLRAHHPRAQLAMVVAATESAG